MNILIFGAGYVGTVTGACLAHCGNIITFIEPNETKVDMLNRGESPILEPRLEEYIQQGLSNNRLRATTSIDLEIEKVDLAMIAVATPSTFNGSLQIEHVHNVINTLKEATRNRSRQLPVVIRSTIHPNALKSIKNACSDSNLSLVINPEFLRESTAVSDFFNAPFCVAGGEDPQSVDLVLSLYKEICQKRYVLELDAACMLKYACNAFHALKIAFANEVGSLCEALNIDSVKLMQVFCEDNQLNCSKAYLKPGFSFGGSCLPKDLRALLSLGRELEEQLPLLSAILPSNQHRFQRAVAEILHEDHQKLAIIGMSFKKNNDDLRESPFVEMIEYLIGKGIQVKIYDPDVKPDRLLGSNLKNFTYRYGHLARYIHSDLKDVLQGCDGIIFCKDFEKNQILDYIQQHSVPFYDLQNHLPFEMKQALKLCAA
jgi:GDP-mannose 6-dehydrogenase